MLITQGQKVSTWIDRVWHTAVYLYYQDGIGHHVLLHGSECVVQSVLVN